MYFLFLKMGEAHLTLRICHLILAFLHCLRHARSGSGCQPWYKLTGNKNAAPESISDVEWRVKCDMRIDERPISMLNNSLFLWVIFSVGSGNVLVKLRNTLVMVIF